MCRKEGRCYAGEHQAREDSDGEDILLDLLPPLRLCGTKDDALDAVVYPPASLEGNGVRGAREVVEIGLEEPEGLKGLGLAGIHASGRHSVLGAHQKRAVDRLLAQVYYEFLQCHGLIVDANEEVA